MALPKFFRTRPGAALSEHVRRLEEAVGAYAQALTGERGGLLSHGLTLREHAKGRVYALAGVTCPSDWRALTWANGWASNGSYVSGAWRKGDDGRVYLRGVGARGAGMPASGSSLITGLPGAAGVETYAMQTDAGVGTADMQPSGTLIYYSGGAARWPLTGMSYDAADRSPLAWPTTSQPVVLLGEDYPGTPEVVRVEDAVTEAGVHLGPCAVEWEADTVGGRKAVRLRRVAGLTPGTKYTLILAVLAA